MKTKINCILFLAFCLSIVGTGFGEIFIGNADFEDVSIELGDYTYNIAPWLYANAVGSWPAWIDYGFYGDEPEPVTNILFTSACDVYQSLSTTYEDGGIYVYCLDVAVYYETDDWEFYLYDATAGDYSKPLISRASTDPGEEQIPLLEWVRKSLTFVATSAEAGHQIGVGMSGWEYPMFDNLTLEVLFGAYLPDPYDGQTNVLVDKTLSWHTGRDPDNPSLPNPNITQHMLYMSSDSSTDPNLDFKASIPATGDTAEYTPAVELDRETTYYWRVDERLESDANVITGDVWMFETVGTIPVIDDATPADALVDAGDDAVFTVLAFNPFTGDPDDLSFEWYKAGEPNDVLSDGADYSGAQTASLTVLDAQIADNDEAQYYCVVTNTEGNTESNTSRSAWLSIRKMLAYWPFDEGTGDVAFDFIGLNNAAMTDHTWITPGLIGDAAISATDATEVNAGSGPTPTTEDLTLAWWMMDNHASYGTIMNKAAESSTSGYTILVRPASEDSPLRFRIGGSENYGDWPDECRLPAGAYDDGVWVHIACTYDSATDTATIYVNGELAPNGDYNPKVGGIAGDDGYCDGVNNAAEPLYIVGSPETFTGLIDEVRLFNYALEPLEIANLYLDDKPDGTVCLSYPAMDISGPDGKPDCVVGLFDFALIASQWIQCNLLPDCM